MATCPVCFKPLEIRRQREGLFYSCESCDGRAVTISQIRHVLGERIATKLLRLIKMSRRASERKCAFCDNPMLAVACEAPVLELEACRACSAVWFDNPTYESLPLLTTETINSIPLQATELIAMERLKELKARMEEERKAAQKKKRLHRNPGDDRGPAN